MKNIFLLFALLFAGALFSQTTADKTLRDSLFQDDDFRGRVLDITYGIGYNIVSDTSAYSIQVRPFFDRLIANPDAGTREYYTNMVGIAVLNTPGTVIDLTGSQTIQSQLEYILQTLGVWQFPANAYIRHRNE